MVIKQKLLKELEKERSKVIEKGGAVSSDAKEKKYLTFTCRMTWKMRNEINEALERTVGLSATGWVLQAIQEKLKREKE